MRHLVLVLILVLAVIASPAQEVISSGGDAHTAGGIEVSWTIGEVFIGTHTGNRNIVTQGFHQTGLSVTAITESLLPEIEIALFPNPTAEFLMLELSEYLEGLSYILLDMTGRVMENKRITSANVRISMSRYEKGTYLLKVMDTSLRDIQTFRVVKY